MEFIQRHMLTILLGFSASQFYDILQVSYHKHRYNDIITPHTAFEFTLKITSQTCYLDAVLTVGMTTSNSSQTLYIYCICRLCQIMIDVILRINLLLEGISRFPARFQWEVWGVNIMPTLLPTKADKQTVMVGCSHGKQAAEVMELQCIRMSMHTIYALCWLGNGWLYPYLSGLLYCYWVTSAIVPVSVKHIAWRI